ncbi:MAG: NnrU family protein [Maricaulaceae bacterium]
MMTVLLAGVMTFIIAHSAPIIPGVKPALVGRLSVMGYKGAVSLVSMLAMVLIVWGWGQAPRTPIYDPPAWSRHAVIAAMAVVSILIASAYAPSRLKAWVGGHPMVLGVALWAGLHLLANGDLASVILFGGLGLYAALDYWSARRRGPGPEVKAGLAATALSAGLGLAAWAGMVFAHGHVIGVGLIE